MLLSCHGIRYFAFSLTLILLLFVVPQFAEMYGEKFPAELPTINPAVLLAMSQFLQHHFYRLDDCVHFRYFYTEDGIKTFPLAEPKKNILVRRMPIWGNIICLSRLINFSHNLQLMLQSE